ncbi:helix-turn-helix domain protein [Ochrobactrum quorumnocens]|uniref:Helix-turn-helix domain protein n=1 Tax=Ochrobactrum quorumnocens TaxID=271865 RepID=A0A248UCW2_9HYPH|nr:AraC family transcriptional regulator [[Ochrobactrum] quorumnocens]ASV84169.1 helix-turn-helix domain protein [[Ochrobactrum] quorumnocens]
MRNFLNGIPDEWGPKFAGESGVVTHTQTGPNEISFRAPCHMALVMLSPQPVREVSLNTDRKSVFRAPVGAIEIVPENAELFARWTTSKKNILVGLGPDKLNTLAGIEFGEVSFEFCSPASGQVDDKALLLASLIQDELTKGEESNEIYLDSLITVFSTYLLRSYSTLRNRELVLHKGGLSDRSLRDVRDYIRANISDRLSIERLAQVARLSPSHFLRAFRHTVGQSPHQYVLATRLEMAEDLIVTTDMSLSIIAKLTGFSTHSHMSASMRRYKFTTPRALRRLG